MARIVKPCARSQWEPILSALSARSRRKRENAELAMSLLIEAHSSSAPHRFDTLEALYGSEIASIRLSKRDLKEIIDQVMQTLLANSIPSAHLTAGLARSGNKRVLPVLRELFDRYFDSPNHSAIVNQALYGLINIQSSVGPYKESMKRILRACEHPDEDYVAREAKEFLRFSSGTYQKKLRNELKRRRR
jgi:hypothetical protein